MEYLQWMVNRHQQKQTYRISSIRRLGVIQQIVWCVPGVKTNTGVILKEASEMKEVLEGWK